MLAACRTVLCAEGPRASFEESKALQGQDGGSLCLLSLFPRLMLSCISFSVRFGVGFYSLPRVFEKKKSLEASSQLAEDDDRHRSRFPSKRFLPAQGKLPHGPLQAFPVADKLLGGISCL